MEVYERAKTVGRMYGDDAPHFCWALMPNTYTVSTGLDRQARVLRILGEAWKRYPQLRLGQLLEAVVTVDGDTVFYISDGKLVDALERFATR